MQGNSHVRFLEGKAGVTPLTYLINKSSFHKQRCETCHLHLHKPLIFDNMKKSLLIALFILLVSCNKTYTYVEIVYSEGNIEYSEKEPEKIKAENDTLAYIEAYKKFIISQEVSRLTDETLTEMGISRDWREVPEYFILINPNGDDISNISFNSKEKIESWLVKSFHKYGFFMDYRDEVPLSSDVTDIDSLLIAKQSKVIGDIKFGMKKNEVSSLIKKFNNEMKREHPVFGKSFDAYFIGNFQYNYLKDYYYKDELYKIEIEGDIIGDKYYDQEMPKNIKYAQDVIQLEYGRPDYNFNVPYKHQMKDGYLYTVKQWDINAKTIKICVQSGNGYYLPLIQIYLPTIEEEMKEEMKADKKFKEDSILNSTKNIF